MQRPVLPALLREDQPVSKSDDIIRRVVHAIHDLKSPPPWGSDHYRSGWDDALEAAKDAAHVLTDEDD